MIITVSLSNTDHHTQGLPQWLGGKESTCNAGDTGLIPGSGRSPAERHDNPPQNSSLKNSMDRGAWWATVHESTKSQTGLKGLSPAQEHHTWIQFFFFLVMRTFKILVTFKYAVQCFQLQLPYCTLHPHDIYFHNWNFVPFLSPSPTSGNHQSVLWIHEVGFFWGEGYCFLFLCFRFYRMWDHVVFVFLRLVSLSKMPSRSIHVVANGKISSFLMDQFYR